MKSVLISIFLMAASLAINAQTFPKYKPSDPAVSKLRDAFIMASLLRQSQQALNSNGSINPTMLPPDDGGGTGLEPVVIPVYRDGYHIVGTATAYYGQWAPSSYLGGASIMNWGGPMPIPYWNPQKATFQIGPDPGVQQAQTFWWTGITPSLLSNGEVKPYFAKPTYHHGTNTVSSFSTYWQGLFIQSAGVFAGVRVPEFDVLNNSHNEGGMDHPPIGMVNGFPITPYTAGTDAQWSANHTEWYWPSPGSCNLASMELWDSVRTGSGSVPFTFIVSCVDGIQNNGVIEVPATSLSSLWNNYQVVESVVLSAPISVTKYTEVTYITRLVPSSTFNNMTVDEYVNQQSAIMSERAIVWPEFIADSPSPHNVGSSVFIKITTKLAQ